MKKHILAIIMAVVCLSIVCTLCACGGGKDPEPCTEHSFGAWETEKYSSCKFDGLKLRQCTVCGEWDEQVIPGGHKWGEWETISELSCLSNGLTRRVCTVCDEAEEITEETQGHTWGDWDETKGDCVTDGSKTRACKNCDATEEETLAAGGHDWSEWGYDLVGDPFVQESTCTEKGYIGRECLVCGDQEFEYTDKKGHEWGDWAVEGTCAAGATRTRGCANCDATEEETSAPGEHANIVYEGAVKAEIGKDGSTGTKKCLACGETLAGAKVIRITNLALGGTVEGNSAFWASNSEAYWSRLVDGKNDTGVCSDPKIGNVIETITFNKAGKVEKVVLVVNGKGSTVAGSYDTVTNNEYTISFILLDESGKTVYSSEYFSTKDQVEIVVDIDLDVNVKTLEIKRTTLYQTHNNLWEVYAYTTEYLSACDATGHTWGEETRVEPTCSPDALTNGYITKSCLACGEVYNETLVASHNWTDWDVTNFSCTEGGTMTRSCQACGKVESQTTEGGEHGEVEVQGAKAPTLAEDGYTGDKVCTVCGETVETGKAIAKLVNESANATVGTNGGWAIDGSTGSRDTRPYLNDGDMNTGMTTYTAQRDTTHSLTWENAVSIDTIKLFFNGDGTGKTVGEMSGNLANTNADTTITVTVYGADGTTVVKTQTISTKDLTEYTIDLGSATSVSKIDLVCYVGWNGAKVVNIWEVQTYTKYVAE